MRQIICEPGLSNYYGSLRLKKIDGKFYLCLQDWNDVDQRIEVSEEFAAAFVKEFEMVRSDAE